MRYLLKKPRKLVETTLVAKLKDDCMYCNFSWCNRFHCPFYNKSFSKLFTFIPCMYKHWIYYFMHNPSRNWSFPDSIPKKWHVHHLDGYHYNDEKENLVMLKAGDHLRLHTLKNPCDKLAPKPKLTGITGLDNYHVFYLY